MKNDHAVATDSSAKDTVLAFLKAINEYDFITARKLASDQLVFVGVLGKRNGADAYFADMERMRFHYNVKKVLADNSNVAVLYDIKMGDKTIFCSGWYEVEDGRVSSIRVVFDPRPLLETSGK